MYIVSVILRQFALSYCELKSIHGQKVECLKLALTTFLIHFSF